MSRAGRRLATPALGALMIGLAAFTAGPEEKTMKGTKPGGAGAIATSLLPAPSSPLVVFRIQFRTGAIDDPAGKEGLNALTALTIGDGGTGDLTFREVTDRLYPLAASIRAQPDHEVTTFVGTVHRDHLKAFYDLFTGVLLTPRFDPLDFTRHRDDLLASIETNLRGNDDETLGKESLQWLLYRDHPYGHPVSGTVRGLKSITLEDVKAFHNRRYTRGNLILGVAGGYPEGMIASLVEDFSALPAGAPERKPLPAPRAIQGMEVLLVEKPAPATAISIGFPISVTRSDKDFYALMVANSFLGEHRTFNGRLMNSMRGDRGLNYGDYSYIENFIQEGGSTFPLPNVPRRRQHFSIWIRPVLPHNTLFALRQATRELKRLVEKGLTAEEFEQTRRYVLNYSRLWTQDLSRRLGYRMDSEFYGTEFFIDRIQQALPRLKVEDVNAAIKRHLNAAGMAVAIVTDKAGEVKETLLSGKPTPITYQTPTTSEDLLKEDKEIEAFPLPLNKERIRVVPVKEMFER
jgi:zinc protease